MNVPSEIKKGTRQNMFFFCEDHIDLEVTDIGTDYKAVVKHLLYADKNSPKANAFQFCSNYGDL